MNKYIKEEEVWKDVSGYEGYYQVSTNGRVRSVDRISCGGRNNSKRYRYGVVLKQLDNKGYKLVNLYKEGRAKKVIVSRLVAETFIDNPGNKPEVNHIDEDKENNSVTNLEWVTPKENSNHGTRNKRISDYFNGRSNKPGFDSGAKKRLKSVLQIDNETGEVLAEFKSVKEALAAFGANPKSGGISRCLTGNSRSKTFRGYKWKYNENCN